LGLVVADSNQNNVTMEERITMKTLSKTILAAGLLGLNAGANAALVNGSVLNINAGSYFELAGGGAFLSVNIAGLNGIVLGTSQLAGGTHLGIPDGTESPNIDQPWIMSDNTGLHLSISPTHVLSATGNTAQVDFSGWRMNYAGDIYNVQLGGLSWDGNPDGVALITCALDCGNGDSYTLHYSATVPPGDPTGFGDVTYRLNLQGTVTAVPLPTAVWLLGSSLAGMIGLGRRKIKSQ
jgi:hypothetical protein